MKLPLQKKKKKKTNFFLSCINRIVEHWTLSLSRVCYFGQCGLMKTDLREYKGKPGKCRAILWRKVEEWNLFLKIRQNIVTNVWANHLHSFDSQWRGVAISGMWLICFRCLCWNETNYIIEALVSLHHLSRVSRKAHLDVEGCCHVTLPSSSQCEVLDVSSIGKHFVTNLAIVIVCALYYGDVINHYLKFAAKMTFY